MIGSCLGPYEITAKLGEGGMGEVYRATDAKLRREVAIKVLPEAVAADTERLARFEREAQLLAQLQHPHIASIYGLEESAGHPALVMELVEGPTLEERMAEGALSTEEALPIVRQIAEALEAAHEKGIVHRDLKPQNVKLTPSGKVKVLDFGLAKAMDPVDAPSGARSASQLAASPTLTLGATVQGVILGTAGYMAPEQAKGATVDKRADIWAFGVLLWEMLTGRRLFEGDSVPETLAGVLKSSIDLDALPTTTPPAIRRLLRRCLEREPRDRLHDIADARIVLSDVMEGVADPLPSGSLATRPASRARLAATLVSALAAVLVAFGLGRLTTPGPAEPPSSPIPAHFRQLTDTPGIEQSPTLSPDGKEVVFVGDERGKRDLYWMRLGDRSARLLMPDSPADDSAPQYSPDGERIAFRSERDGGGVFVMRASGQSVRRLSDFGFDPSWSPDGEEIVVSMGSTRYPTDIASQDGDLLAIDVESGERRILSKGKDPQRPRWSPQGHRIAFWALRSGSGQRDIFTVAADGSDATGEPVGVTDDGTLDWSPAWSPDGRHLFFSSLRGGTMNLWRVPIDETTGQVLGEPEPVTVPASWAGEVSFGGSEGQFAFSTLDWSTTLQHVSFDAEKGDLSGSPQPMLESHHPIRDHRVSSDGEWIVMTLRGAHEDLAVVRVDGSHFLRLTDDAFRDRWPLWSPDGSQIYFFSDRSGSYGLWTIRPDGSGLEFLSEDASSVAVGALSPDGRQLFGSLAGTASVFDLASNARPLPSRTHNVILDGGERFWPEAWSPDGERLAGPLIRSDGSMREIAIYSLADEGIERIAIDTSNFFFAFMQWLPEGRRLLVRTAKGIQLIDGDTHERRMLVDPGGYWIGESFDLVPERGWLTWSETATEGGIWVAELALGDNGP